MPASFFTVIQYFADRLRQPVTRGVPRSSLITLPQVNLSRGQSPLLTNHLLTQGATITRGVPRTSLITLPKGNSSLITCACGAIITARSALLPCIYAANNGHLQRKRALLFATGFAAAAVCFYKHVAVEFGALFAAYFVPARGEEIDSLCIGQCIYALCPSLFKPHFGSV